MIYADVCSGISAPTVAWAPLGWRPAFYSEIDRFPRAVLKHHYPGTPLAGDFTKIEDGDYEPIDLLVGGTPCQSFSVAGKRLGLDDPRGNLAIEFLRLAQRLRPTWICFENVPGLLSSGEGRDFGAFLGLLGECGYGWAYRTLDAQHFGVPQRRRRVFVVGYSGELGRSSHAPAVQDLQRFSQISAAVLFEPESLSGHPPPRREAGKGVAGSLDASAGGCDENDARDGRLIVGALATNTGPNGNDAGNFQSNQAVDAGHLIAYGGNRTSGPTDTATAVNAHGRPHGRLDFESETFVVPVQCNGSNIGTDLPSLRRGDGGLTSGVPAIAFHARQDPDSGPVTHPLDQDGHSDAVAFSCKDSGADVGEVSTPLRALNHDKGHANAGGQVAVAFAQNSRSEVRQIGGDGQVSGDGAADHGVQQQTYIAESVNLRGREGGATAELSGDRATALRASQGGGDKQHVLTEMRVRRITPIEAERLQGFPDDFTRIPWRGKPAEDCPDGPRYRALGNSMAVPVVRWIGARIQAFEEIDMEALKPQAQITASRRRLRGE